MKENLNMKENNTFLKNKKYFLPIFAVNDAIEPGNIYKKFKQFSDVGLESLILWFGTGLEIKFYSDEFFERYKNILEIAKKFGFKLWIWDDFNWPSGSSAGFILEDKECREKFLEYSYFKGKNNSEIFMPNDILSAFSIKGNKVKSLSNLIKGNSLKYSFENDEEVLIFYEDYFEGNLFSTRTAEWTNNLPYYVDLLNKQAVDKYIEFNFETLKRFFKDEFGKTIVGIFTDEPAILMRWPGYAFYVPEGNSYPWSNVLEDEFKNHLNYDLRPNLYKLIIDSQDSYKFRIDYFKVVSKLYSEAFYKNIASWCHNNNLLFTGHLLFEEEIPQFVTCEANFYENQKYFDFPGIDTLKEHNDINMVKRDITAKLASSLRNIDDKNYALSEICGATGWVINFEDMKNIIGRLINFGINIMAMHSVASSIKGFRKKMMPLFDYQPYWEGFKEFLNFFARISFILEESKELSAIAFLYPTENLWANFKPDPENRDKNWKEIQNFIEGETNNLIRSQVNYNYIFEEIALESNIRIDKDKIYFKNIDLKTLILPPINYLSPSLKKFLQKFLKNGGNILSTSKIVNSTFKDYEKNISAFEYSDNFINEVLQDKFIKESEYYDIQGELKNYIYSSIRKINEDLNVLILHNQSLKTGLSGDIKIKIADKSIERIDLLNLEDGTFYSITDYTNREEEQLTLNVYFNKNDLLIFLLYKNSSKPCGFYKDIGLNEIKIEEKIDSVFKISVCSNPYDFLLGKSQKINKNNVSELKFDDENLWDFRIPFNFYPLNNIRIKQDREYEGKKSGYYKPDFMDTEWARIKLTNIDDYDHLANQEDLYGLSTPPELRETSTNYWIRGEFFIEKTPKDIFLVYEDINDIYEIYINGIIFNGFREQFFVWDNTNIRINIKDYIVSGNNKISIVTRTPKWTSLYPFDHYVEPIVLIGDFIVKECKILNSNNKIKIGSWVNQGYPNFVGTGIYKNSFTITKETIDDLNKDKKLFLKIENLKEVAEIIINDKNVGRKIFQPFIFNISDVIKIGKNEVSIKVSNTLSNLFTKQIDSGLIGAVSILVL